MSLTRRRFHQLLLGALAVGLAPQARATALVEGRDFGLIVPAQPPEEAGRIEVLEFFSYGCPHCGQLNPLIKAWAAGLPADVRFQRVPVSFGRAAWASLARLYFALEYSGDLARLDQAVFDAIGQRTRLFTERDILAWLADRDVDTDAFAKLFNGFAVETRLGRADTLSERFRITAVPTITVGGRYVVLAEAARSYADLLAIADALIDKARTAG